MNLLWLGYLTKWITIFVFIGLWITVLGQDQDNFYFDPSPVSQEVVEGEGVRLRCDVSNRKMISFYWTLNDTKVAETSRRFLEQGDLRILRADRVLDAGSFRCVATNVSTGMALRSTEAKLNVLWISKITEVQVKTLRDGEALEEGMELTFKCQVDGNREPSVEWFRNKFRIFPTNRIRVLKNRLKISGGTAADNGVYSCIARNEAGIVESDNNFILNIPGRNTARLDVDSFTRRQLARRGGSTIFNCSFTGASRTEWYFDEKRITFDPLDQASKYRILENGTLIINSIKDSDSGSYQCAGMSERGPVQTFTVELQLAYLEEPGVDMFTPALGDQSHVVVEVGGKLELLCEAPSGLPVPDVRWHSQDGITLSSETDRLKSNKGVFTISDALESDSGNYTCTVSNIAGNYSRTVWIIVSVAPIISIPPLSLRVSEDEEALFECRTKSTPHPVTVISWMKEYEPINTVLEPRLHVDQLSGSLTIQNVTLLDEGNYACVVSTTGHPPVTSINAHLYVEKRLKFKPEPKDTVLELGSRSQVECRADGRVPPSVQWLRGGEEVGRHSGGDVMDLDGVLVFRQVEREQADRYTCRAASEQGVISASVNIEVVVSPKFKVRPQNATALEGSSIMLHCVAYGEPVPSVEWDRNNLVNHFDRRRFKILANGSLAISEVYMEDVGRYGCKATNRGGATRIEVYLHVTNSAEMYERMRDGERPLYADDHSMMKTIVIAVCSAVAYLAVVVGLTAYCIVRLIRSMNLRKQRQLEAANGTNSNHNGHATFNCKLSGNKDYDVIENGDVDRRSLLSAAMPTTTTVSHLSNSLAPQRNGTILRSLYGKLAFPRSQLQTLGMLGKGHYGDVFLARATSIVSGQPDSLVMVKSLVFHGEENTTEFRRELELFGRANHQHVVRLLGVCREKEPMFLITEYCEWGDLKKFLLATRSDSMGSGGMLLNPLNLRQKVTICGQVALAMEHLSNSGLVHRDLAARNVLLAPSLDVKVSSPALCRDAYASEYYALHSRAVPIPLRWTAPEAIIDGDWSSDSDVWSFGVFAWEVFSDGELPLRHKTDQQVLEGVERRENRLMCPLGCSQDVWSLIQTCLVYNADIRPSFSDIVTLLYDISTDNLYSD